MVNKGNTEMRPYKMTENRGLQPDMSAELYVKRDTMTDLWRLAWMTPNSDSYCYAEGECSAKLFKRRYEAVAYGEKAYGETAKNWK
jgi:hypothetical protein